MRRQRGKPQNRTSSNRRSIRHFSRGESLQILCWNAFCWQSKLFLLFNFASVIFVSIFVGFLVVKKRKFLKFSDICLWKWRILLFCSSSAFRPRTFSRPSKVLADASAQRKGGKISLKMPKANKLYNKRRNTLRQRTTQTQTNKQTEKRKTNIHFDFVVL